MQDFVALVDRLEFLATRKELRHVSDLWGKANDRIVNDPSGAATCARSLVEASCKVALDTLEVEYKNSADLPFLYSLTAEALGIKPALQNEDVLKRFFSALHTIIQSLTEIRNKHGDAHGSGIGTSGPSQIQCELAVNMAGAASLFLLSSLEHHIAGSKRLNSEGMPILWFDKATVWRLLDHARNASESAEFFGEQIGPALILVGDSGIYLMSNGRPVLAESGLLQKDARPGKFQHLVAYAEGCDPDVDAFEFWWTIHNAVDEGSDFSFPIDLGEVEEALKSADRQIVVTLGKTDYEIWADTSYSS